MGSYSVPEEIRRLKPKGTSVKPIKGNYYVYTHSQIKDPKTGKWKTATGKLVGKIIPGVGFCPSSSETKTDQITCFDYGEYVLGCKHAKEDLKLLKECFNPEDSMIIISLSLILALFGYVGLKKAEDLYERSLVARDYPALKFRNKKITTLLEMTGRTEKAKNFQMRCFESSSTLAIDGHAIRSISENNDLSTTGYKTRSIKSDYMNLIVAFDIKTGEPVSTKVFPGYMLDKSAFIDFISTFGSVKNKLLLMDMGFFSKENVEYIIKNGGSYIIPVSENRTEYKEYAKTTRGKRASFIYYKGKKNDVVEYKEYIVGSKKFVYFKNITEAEKLSYTYLCNLDKGEVGYTEEKYERLNKEFGVIMLETNMVDKNAKEIYESYISRWSIETYYDRIKNGINFESLNIDDWALLQGVAFVMMIAGRIDARILNDAKKLKMTRKELLSLFGFLKLTDNKKSVTIHNQKARHAKVAEKLELLLDPAIKCLD